MDRKCLALNRNGDPCARVPAPGSLKCYKHADGTETLLDEELDALIAWYEDLQLLADIEHPSADQVRECEALWILIHAYETLARQRAGLRSQCPVPCGLCAALGDVFDAVDRAAASTIAPTPVVAVRNPAPRSIEDEPEDPMDTSVEFL
jgi:hypothetical protein